MREIEAAATPSTPDSVMTVRATQDTTDLTPDAKALLADLQEGDAERIRQLAQRDMAATANVLRMWLEQKA